MGVAIVIGINRETNIYKSIWFQSNANVMSIIRELLEKYDIGSNDFVYSAH